MGSDRLREEQARFFSLTFSEHGATGRGVDWKDDAAQSLRFEQLLRVLDTSGEFTINDYGCGWGALIPFLDAHGLRYRYCGYDIAEPLLAFARSRYENDERKTFVADDGELPVADYTVASGIFNRKFDTGGEEWTSYVLQTVDRMYSVSGVATAFNLLTKYSDPERQRPDLYYADPAVVLDHCARHLSRHVTLLHDYGAYEFLVVVRREPFRA